jgi:calcium-dependent protein kinase
VKDGTFEFRSPEWDSISQGAKNLVTQMLTVDPALRPCANVLLANPWLKFKGEPSNPAPISADYVNRLQNFQAMAKFKKVALTAIAQQMPDEKIQALQDTFRALDQDGDGTLSAEEVRSALVKQGLAVPQALDTILRRVDCNGSGGVDYTEWLAATIDQKLYMERDVLWAAFRSFDLDGDGRITREELDKVLNGDQVQKTLGANKIDQMIRQFDTNGDGIIDFDEFCAMMKPSQQSGDLGAMLHRSAKRQRV